MSNVLSDPDFDPELFLTYVAIHKADRDVLSKLIVSLPPLLLFEYDEQLAINIFWSQYAKDIREALEKHNNPTLIRKLAEQAHRMDTGAVKTIAKYVDQPMVEGWLSTLDGDRMHAAWDGLASNPTKMDPDFVVQMWEYTKSKQWPIPESAAIIALTDLPADHEFIRKVAHHPKDTMNVRKAAINRMRLQEKVKLLAHLFRALNDFHSKELAAYIRQSSSIPKDSGVRCPFCVKKIKSYPGITLHLRQIHEINQHWKSD